MNSVPAVCIRSIIACLLPVAVVSRNITPALALLLLPPDWFDEETFAVRRPSPGRSR